MRSQDRKLLQINSSATTVDAAPLVVANASSSVAGSDSSSSNNDTKPHAILSDVVSAYKSKFKPVKATTPAPSVSDASVTATANATADGGDDYYSTPCSSDPIPSQYEAFVQVRALVHAKHLADASQIALRAAKHGHGMECKYTLCVSHSGKFACHLDGFCTPCICCPCIQLILFAATKRCSCCLLCFLLLHISPSLLLQDIDRESVLLQCICSCPVAYANGPSSAPTMAPMMDPMAMPEDMADAMDSGADADSSGPSAGSGCAPEPVPTQYEAFENVSPFSIFAYLHADTHASGISCCYRG